MTITQTLVLRFNSFTGKLDDAYWLSRAGDIESFGKPMRPEAAYAYLAEHPQTRCKVLMT